MKKRVLALLLIGAMLLVPCTMVSAYTLIGDVDDSGVIDSSDARIVLQISVGKYDAWGSELEAADVDGNGSVDSSDARWILQYAVGKVDEFPNSGSWIDFAAPYEGNSFTPASPKAGSTFLSLDDVKDDAPEVTDSTKQFGYFALTMDDNAMLPFNVQCTIEDGAITALLPAGVDLTAVKARFTYYGDKVLYNGAAAVSGETVFDLSEPVELTMTATDGSTETITVALETLNTGLPSMAVTATDLADIDSKDVYTTASFYLGGGDKKTCSYAQETPILVPGGIKGRGNSSWLLDAKKSYTIKLDKKSEMLDMPKSKNWAIVANYEDKTLLRNYVAAWLAEEAGVTYVMELRPVDMWINGEYWGTYNLTEKIEIEKERVNITDVDDTIVQAPDELGYLIEFDAHVMEANAGGELDKVEPLDPNRWQEYGWTKTGEIYYNPDTDEYFFAVPNLGKWATIKKPSTKNVVDNPERLLYIYNKVMELDSALKARDEQRINALLDVDSFVRWYIVEELMDNTDNSFHSSVYMSLDVDGKFVMGPVWDFDRSSGNCSYWDNTNDPTALARCNWVRYLLDTESGKNALKAAWQPFYEMLCEEMDSYIDSGSRLIAESQKLNFERWDILGKNILYNSDATNSFPDYMSQVEYLKMWLYWHMELMNASIMSR